MANGTNEMKHIDNISGKDFRNGAKLSYFDHKGSDFELEFILNPTMSHYLLHGIVRGVKFKIKSYSIFKMKETFKTKVKYAKKAKLNNKSGLFTPNYTATI